MKTTRSFSLTYQCNWQMPGEIKRTARRAGHGVAASMDVEWLPAAPMNDNGFRGRGHVRLASARS